MLSELWKYGSFKLAARAEEEARWGKNPRPRPRQRWKDDYPESSQPGGHHADHAHPRLQHQISRKWMQTFPAEVQRCALLRHYYFSRWFWHDFCYMCSNKMASSSTFGISVVRGKSALTGAITTTRPTLLSTWSTPLTRCVWRRSRRICRSFSVRNCLLVCPSLCLRTNKI